MKQWISLLLILAMGCFLCAPARAIPTAEPYPMPSVSARSAILMNPENGDVYFEKNADEPMGMASTTKLMTALVVLDSMDPEDIITVSEDAVGIEGSSIYLIKGEQLTVRQLLYALLLSSANDAAAALAIALSGSVEAFSQRMNQRAEAMGLSHTHFTNPHGLYDEDHYTTARELSQIGAEVLRRPLLKEIVSTSKATIPHDTVPDQRLLVNHNKLLRTYEGAIGMKTGYTKATGRTLVSAAERNGMTLIAVTLNAPDDWRDHTALLDYGFASYEKVVIAPAGTVSVSLPLTGGCEDTVRLTNQSELTLILPRQRSEIGYAVESTGHFCYAPIREGASVGRISVSCEGQSVASALIATQAVASATPKKKGFFERLFTFFDT